MFLSLTLKDFRRPYNISTHAKLHYHTTLMGFEVCRVQADSSLHFLNNLAKIVQFFSQIKSNHFQGLSQHRQTLQAHMHT